VRSIASVAIVLAVATAVRAQLPSPGVQTPWAGGTPSWSAAPSSGVGVHPAVVRIIVPDRDGISLGSGALVAVRDQHALVLTNWHVVREAAGPIVVAFPDGFRSGATVLKTDSNWDLAALAIWRPNVAPIPVAIDPPRPGELLSIAGYGSGSYRTITGRCTQYVAPGRNQPFEMVELSAPARQGDSGGPILNSRGELAGVLFGTAAGQTAGSYCGRVRTFVASVGDSFARLQPSAIASAKPPGEGVTVGPGALPPRDATTVGDPLRQPLQGPLAATGAAPPRMSQPGAPPSTPWPAAREGGASSTISVASSPLPGAGSPTVALSTPPKGPHDDLEETSLWDLTRNVLALIGGVAIFFHAVRLLTPGAPSTSGEKGS